MGLVARPLTLALPLFMALVLLLGSQPQQTGALAYAFDTATTVCFVEEISSADHMVTGRYNWLPHPDKSIAVHLVLYGPDYNLVTTEDMSPGERVFQISLGSRQPGSYRLCAEVTSPHFKPDAKPPLMIEFDVDQTKATTGAARMKAADGAVAIRREEVDGLAVFTFTDVGGETKTVLQPKQLLRELDTLLSSTYEAVGDVAVGLNYFLERESRMRDTAESTFGRVWVWAAVTAIATGLCIWAQFRVLKGVIVKKKLI